MKLYSCNWLDVNFIILIYLDERGMHYTYTMETTLVGWWYGLNDGKKSIYGNLPWHGVTTLVNEHKQGSASMHTI